MKLKSPDKPVLFAYPRLSQPDFGLFRVGGHGLGNLLFPWARALSSSRQFGLTRIFPTWLQFVFGPMLRREQDWRIYCGRFRPSVHEVCGIRRLGLLARLPRFTEADLRDGSLHNARPGIVCFQGMDGYFDRLLHDYRMVRQELLASIRCRYLIDVPSDLGRTVVLHVRRGDFSQPRCPSDIISGKCNLRIPLQWYVGVVKEIRRRLGECLPVWVFSDGADDDLVDLLRLPGARRVSYGSSVSDLVAMSRARLLVASGSTFSMWASYLGRMPVIWHTGQLRQRLYVERPEAEQECQNPAELPDHFFQLVRYSHHEPIIV